MANVLKYVKSAPSFRSSLPFFFATHYPFPRNDKVSSRSLANRLPLEVSPSSSRSAVRLNCHRFRTTCGHQRVPHGSPGPNALWRPVEIRVARHCLTTPILPDFPFPSNWRWHCMQLTVQNSALILVCWPPLLSLATSNWLPCQIMHYSRVMPVVNGARYFTSTAVVMNEVLKLIICTAVVIREKVKENKPWSLASLWEEVMGGDAWKLVIPAVLYTVHPHFSPPFCSDHSV